MPFTVGVPRETAPGETRVALTPDVVQRLARKGATVVVERGAGEAAAFPDADYAAAGAAVVDRAAALGADLVATVQGLDDDALGGLRRGALVVGLLRPLDDPAAADRLARAGATAVAMELVP
ncbi:MAG TPA: hypothetical protein VK002_04540, partial [Rubricoccaceae bacterium]|nr:hypothetical protein [Rubricoccaceae bacterium]